MEAKDDSSSTIKKPKLDDTDVAELLPVTKETIPDIKKLIAIVIPVAFPESFYKQVENGSVEGLGARVQGRTVGCVIWGPNPSACSANGKSLYVYAIAVEALWRSKGIGKQLVEEMLKITKDLPIELHVHSVNEDAIQFYERFGFKRESVVKNFYRRLDPQDAMHMLRVPSSSGEA